MRAAMVQLRADDPGSFEAIRANDFPFGKKRFPQAIVRIARALGGNVEAVEAEVQMDKDGDKKKAEAEAEADAEMDIEMSVETEVEMGMDMDMETQMDVDTAAV
mmetsp:Transcript_16348/g.46956  ORF Transcript_16348/g.46956 Transcript_16348/m.46956 type:complete len:104 (-) Transcript_16348:344-655(-)